MTAPLATTVGLEIVGVLDDDVTLQDTDRAGHIVRAPSAIHDLETDAVLITNHQHPDEVRDKMGPHFVNHVPILEM